MIIKIGETYNKVIDKHTKKEFGKEQEKQILEIMKVTKSTLDLAENYVHGDCMSYLSTGVESRKEIYEKVLNNLGISAIICGIHVEEEMVEM